MKDVEKYRVLFLEECREHLQGLSRELLRLEEEGEKFDGIDTLFREAHSIKGMASSMGYDPMVSLSHAMEDLFDGFRKKVLEISPEIVALLFEGVDTLGHLADEVEERGGISLDARGLVEKIRAAAHSSGSVAADRPSTLPPGSPGEVKVRELTRRGKLAYHCSVTVSRDTASVAARNFVVLGRLGRAGEIIHSTPSLEEVVEGKGSAVLEILVATERSEEDLSALLLSVPELTDFSVTPLRVEEPRGPAPVEEAEVVFDGMKPSRKDASRQLLDHYLPRASATVKVATDILDDLINIVGELIITRDRLLDISRDRSGEDLHQALDRLDFLVKGFQGTIMAVRMMPLEVITDRLPRIVRDMARRDGKEIRFEILGKGIELDRAVLEELNDVLVHLVRNAIDHGVESVEERRAAGKDERALVRIAAGRERDWVWITVEDDGRGMDTGKIKRKALEMGLITPERAEAMELQEAFLLACEPGVSTAEKVSDISGRGVGMDVVKSRVESFGGSLSLDSTPGGGTRTTLHLPLTLAIVQLLLVELRGQIFGLPVSQIIHTLEVQPEEVKRREEKAVIQWGEKIPPLRDLAGLVGLPERDLAAGEPFNVVLTEEGGVLSGLAVDRLLGTSEAVIKPTGAWAGVVAGLAGATVMGDGSTVLVLDLKTLA